MSNSSQPNDRLEQAVAILECGGIVAVPTETVYGLAANAHDADAIARIYKTKGRPAFNPLIAHASDLAMAQVIGEFDDLSLRLAETFWPGPLTLVVPILADTGIAPAVTAGLPTIALRHPLGSMAELAKRIGSPLAAPSANSSGKVSPTCARHVQDDLGNKVDLILDEGDCKVGVESTIVKVDDGKVVLLRAGGLPVEDIEAVVGPVHRSAGNPRIEAPGMMLSHYAPSSPIRLNANCLTDGEALLAFGAPLTRDAPQLNLSPSGDLKEAAHNLFSMIKQLDALNPLGIAVQPIPETGLGAAINDRLSRAAQGTR